jgi:hypothetical protein
VASIVLEWKLSVKQAFAHPLGADYNRLI